LSRLEALRKAWAPQWSAWVSESVVEALRSEYMPDLPPLEAGGYLVAYLFEAGPVMDAGPLSFGELESWCRRLGIDLQPWEARCLCRLSREYLNESRRAALRDAKAPWLAPDAKPEITDTQAAFRALAKL
jgi:hypothetical protein